ncbi:MAG: transglutaminase domain-containing protein [Candidatus Diapherotrites archaeon]|nr:transglutaminase domain-containing protein [Candidatus Diapherotrites archaeon]
MNLSKLFLILFFMFFLMNSFSLEIQPNSISFMDAVVSMTAEGTLLGKTSENDSITFKALSFNEFEGQKISELNEKLFFDGKEFSAESEIINGSRYAVFKVDKLNEFSLNPEFKIIIKARVQRESEIELNKKQDFNAFLDEFTDYLNPTFFIESNDPQLIAKAGIEFRKGASIETLMEITDWVSNNIEYDYDFYPFINSAKKTYELRKGVCDEFANLTAAFARIKGIPAKYVSGISFDGKEFGSHGWNELFIQGKGWLPVDSTFSEAGFVDAAHIILSKGKDANEFSSVETTINSVNDLKIEMTLLKPEIEIIKVTHFTDLTETELIFPEKLSLGEKFSVKAKIKSIASTEMIFPVELLLHEEFISEKEKHLLLVKPGKTIEIEWIIVSPLDGEKGKYFTYTGKFFSPDSEKEIELNVFPEETIVVSQEGEIKLIDVSPFKENNSLKVSFKIQNTGTAETDLNAWLEFNEKKFDEKTISLNGNELKQLNLSLDSFNYGTVFLVIESNELKSITEIFVPLKQEPVIIPQTQKQDEAQKTTEISSNPLNDFIEWLFSLIKKFL